MKRPACASKQNRLVLVTLLYVTCAVITYSRILTVNRSRKFKKVLQYKDNKKPVFVDSRKSCNIVLITPFFTFSISLPKKETKLEILPTLFFATLLIYSLFWIKILSLSKKFFCKGRLILFICLFLLSNESLKDNVGRWYTCRPNNKVVNKVT